MKRRKYLLWVLASLMVIGSWHRVWAQDAAADYGRPTYEKPMYDPVSKRYFELVGYWEHPWREAVTDARKQVFMGVPGQLAVVDSLEIHEFLLRNFRTDQFTWIGYEYWCAAQALVDSNGQHIVKPDFQAWAPKWNPDPYACNDGVLPKDRDYSPIAYTPVSQGFRWTGWGPAKHFHAYFVEFRTGHP